MFSIQLSQYGHRVCHLHGNTPIREWTNTSLGLRASGSSWNGEEWSPNPQLTLPCPAPLRACYGLIMGSKCFPLGVLATKLSAPLCDSREDEWHMIETKSSTWSASHIGQIWQTQHDKLRPMIYFNRLLICRYIHNTELT